MPADEDHPFFDETGANCGAGQGGKVWFLVGALTDEVPETDIAEVTRDCVVPTGRAIFFPILNSECSTVEDPPFFGQNESELRACAASFIDGPNAVVTDLTVEVDGKPLRGLSAYRAQSPLFDFALPENNVLGVDDTTGQSVSDGYYILLPPLSRGEHTIGFTGSFVDPVSGDLIFGVDVFYNLTVVGGK